MNQSLPLRFLPLARDAARNTAAACPLVAVSSPSSPMACPLESQNRAEKPLNVLLNIALSICPLARG